MIFFLLCSLTTFGQRGLSADNQDSTIESSFLISVPYESVKGEIIIKVGIKGKSYRFILDTGSSTLISKSLYDELNPKIIKKINCSDQSALKDSINIVSVDEMTIGIITFNNAEVGVLKESNPFIECFNVDGFIGSDFLSGLVVQISSPDKRIRLTNDIINLSLYGIQSDELILDEQFNPHFSIKLKNNKKEEQQSVLFDTGDSEFLTLSHLDYLTLKKDKILIIDGVANGSNSIGINGHAIDTIHYRLRAPRLDMNGLQFKNVSALTTQGRSSRIGSMLLEKAIVTLDFPKRRYYLQTLSSPKIDVTEKKVPFDPDIRDGKVVVGFIWDYSVCKKIEVGDEIIKINDIIFQNMNPCDLFNTELSLKGAKKVLLTTKDKNGDIHKTTFRKR